MCVNKFRFANLLLILRRSKTLTRGGRKIIRGVQKNRRGSQKISCGIVHK